MTTKILARIGLTLALISTLGLPLASNQATPAAAVSSLDTPQSRPQLSASYGKIPLSFEANHGQAEGSGDFLARGPGYLLALFPTEAVFALGSAAPRQEPLPGAAETSTPATAAPPFVLRMNILGANPAAVVAGERELEGKANYLIGNDPALWRTNVPTFGRVRYAEVYPGIDVIYYGNQERLEYDFVVAPGRDPGVITLAFAGAERCEVEPETGDLLLHAGGHTIRQHKPISYQETDGGRREVASRYAVTRGGRVSFEVENYDARATADHRSRLGLFHLSRWERSCETDAE